jgi:mannose-6-phosphate isomerase
VKTENNYPYILAPKLVPAIWGGKALTDHFGKLGSADNQLGESWECWDDNRVLNGPLAGSTLADLRVQLQSQLMGAIDHEHIFPILTKIIDAQKPLSVQVHPDDKYAQATEHQQFGKTECWHILDAQPDAELILGWSRDTNRQEYQQRVENGSLGDILRHLPVKAGDSFYLPAGTLHAIGAGIQLFETQQASDLTYRIFDWNRVDANGNARQLHVDKAADVLDFSATFPKATASLVIELDGLRRTILIADSRFLVERLDFTNGRFATATHNRPFAVMALNKPLCVQMDETEIELNSFATAIIPAAARRVTFASAGGGALLARPNPDLAALRQEVISASVIEPLRPFLAQFN